MPYALPPHPAHPYLASTGERVGARLIDLLIQVIVLILVGLPLVVLLDLGEHLDPRRSFAGLEAALGTGPLIVGVIYALVTEGRTGQTPGKRLVGIRAVRIDDRPFRWTDALVRWLCLVVDNQFVILGLVLIATHPYKQRVGDRAAGTIVVRAR